MRRRDVRQLTAFVVTVGVLLIGRAAVATEHLFEAMGMTKVAGKAAPDFTLPSIDGQQVSLQQYRGKVVFLNFWATWCIPCREEMPGLEQLHQKYQSEGFVVLAIDLKESAEQVKTFFQKHGLSFPSLLDQQGSVFRDYLVAGMPTTYLIGRDGKLFARGIGGRDWTRAEAQELIRTLVKKGPTEAGASVKGGP
jgi:cytochrome c biogenesis protein CcmG, thiol:disulfide interchange protein DsbE